MYEWKWSIKFLNLSKCEWTLRSNDKPRTDGFWNNSTAPFSTRFISCYLLMETDVLVSFHRKYRFMMVINNAYQTFPFLKLFWNRGNRMVRHLSENAFMYKTYRIILSKCEKDYYQLCIFHSNWWVSGVVDFGFNWLFSHTFRSAIDLIWTWWLYGSSLEWNIYILPPQFL